MRYDQGRPLASAQTDPPTGLAVRAARQSGGRLDSRWFATATFKAITGGDAITEEYLLANQTLSTTRICVDLDIETPTSPEPSERPCSDDVGTQPETTGEKRVSTTTAPRRWDNRPMDMRVSDALAFAALRRTLRQCKAATVIPELADLIDRALELNDAWASERLRAATEAVRN